eukprot:TRINITY_DN9848_c0_g1_i1.p1 TRINITY_DN9848_c0_g1~~TRINITY_DN9848_c0_g1_i1.p1  ORF type:complete len:244 (+),score=59.28 TRINITY_DN9848_c0_g1_i1:71-802(+)
MRRFVASCSDRALFRSLAAAPGVPWTAARWQAAAAAAAEPAPPTPLVVRTEVGTAPRRPRGRPRPASALPKGSGIDFGSPPPESDQGAAPAAATAAPAAEPAADRPLSALERRRRKGSAKEVVTITERAAQRVKELLAHRNDNPTGVSIGVKRRGCNGLSYTMDYYYPDREKGGKPKTGFGFEAVTEQHGIVVHVDAEAFMFVVGTVMDFERTKTEQKFVFVNPNSGGSCGCGESFVPKKAED